MDDGVDDGWWMTDDGWWMTDGGADGDPTVSTLLSLLLSLWLTKNPTIATLANQSNQWTKSRDKSRPVDDGVDDVDDVVDADVDDDLSFAPIASLINCSTMRSLKDGHKLKSEQNLASDFNDKVALEGDEVDGDGDSAPVITIPS